ncbi:MAG: TIGR03067 domain-containing protein [Isosphaeraceae bacterium]
MTTTRSVALALIVPLASIAWGDDSPNDSLDGTWLPTRAELAGRPFPDEVRQSIRLEIQGDQYTVTVGERPDRGTCERNSSANPKTLDITGVEGPNKGKTILAIYERTGDTLRVCYDLGGKSRPSEFQTREGTQLFLVEYKLRDKWKSCFYE